MANELDRLLTIVIPVKNEAKNLVGCLEAIRDFSHVVLVDSSSEDETREIARQFGREVVNFVWDGKFPKKRNWILSNYSFETPWILFLDADERMTEGWRREAAGVLSRTRCDAFVCFYDNWFMGRMLRHGDVMRKTAVLRVGAGAYERIEEEGWSRLDMEIHEHLQVKGSIGVIRARLEHHDKRSLESYYAKHEEYAKWESHRFLALRGARGGLTGRQRVKYGLIRCWWFGLAYFCVTYFLKGGFLDGKAGFVFARGKMRYFERIRELIRGLTPSLAKGSR